MIFNKGFWLILVRVLINLILSFGLVYSYIETELIYTPYMFGGLLLILTLELVWHLQKQARTWARFLESVKYGDFNRSYRYETNDPELLKAYELISGSLSTLKINKEAEFRLLQTVLGHISIAVVCFKDSGEVIFSNKAFKNLFDIEELVRIDQLKNSYPAIYEVLCQSEQSQTQWIDHEENQKLFVKSESFKLKSQALRLTSFADIRSSLELKELESYQNLMRVMTHEIMNSTTPILSLIQVVNNKLLSDRGINTLNEKDEKNTAKSLRAIQERTKGILSFVSAYKRINQPIDPHFEEVMSSDLIRSVVDLVEIPAFVDFEVTGVQECLWIDRGLMAQALINLIKNALEAVEGVKLSTITIFTKSAGDLVNIIVSDNGPGVPEHQTSEIFVPFFTTKKEGSGVGLALSKNILLAHKGTLSYQRVDSKSHFIISLPLFKA